VKENTRKSKWIHTQRLDSIRFLVSESETEGESKEGLMGQWMVRGSAEGR